MSTIQAGVTTTLPDNVDNLTLTGSDNISGYGNALSNVITSNSGFDFLEGGAGDDTYVLTGSPVQNLSTSFVFGSEPGNWVGGNQSKALVFNPSQVTVNLSDDNQDGKLDFVGFYFNLPVVFGTPEFWILQFTTSHMANGTALAVGTYNDVERATGGSPGHPGMEVAGEGRGNNSFTGSSFTINALNYHYDGNGAAVLDSFSVDFALRAQATTMYGIFNYNYAAAPPVIAVIHEDPNGGTDTIQVGSSYSLADIPNVENLTLTGSGNIDATGNGLANVLTGNSGNNVFLGGGGDDTIMGGDGTDTARYSGLASNYQVTPVLGASFRVTDLRAGSPDGTDTLINVERIQWGDGGITTLSYNDRPPVLTTSNLYAYPGQLIPLSSLFSVSDPDGDPIQVYQLWDATRDSASGHFVINGVAQASGTTIDVAASQLSNAYFLAGTAGDNLQIRASDGILSSAGDSAAWAPFTITIDRRPVVTTANVNEARNTVVTLSSLFSVSDADGDSITRYQLWDATRDPNSGHFVVNGVVQAAGTIIDVTAAQLAQTSFVTGRVNDNLQIRAFDGKLWSAGDSETWSPFTVTVPANHVPVVTTANVTKSHLQTFALSSLFSVTDADGDAVTQYQLWDGTRDPNSGHFVVSGVVQAAAAVITISAADLANTSFVTGSVGDSLQIRASDGIGWSAADNAAWAPFSITVPVNHAPVVSTNQPSISPHFQSIALSNLLSVSDADGDSMTKYQFKNDLDRGYFVINGQVQTSPTIEVTAAQLSQASFVTGSFDTGLEIRAFDGITWSSDDNVPWANVTILVTSNHAPVVTTANVSAQHGQVFALTDLFSVADTDGDSMTKYQLWDSNPDPLSGHFTINGVVQPAGQVIEITSGQLAQTGFVAGGGAGDTLQIRAFDGIDWSAADNAAWAPFGVGVAVNHAPVVSTSQSVISHNLQSLAMSSLFSVSDADGDSITKYQFRNDSDRGYFVINGQVQTTQTVEVTAAQLAQTNFVTGSFDTGLEIRAFDGTAWSSDQNAIWANLTVLVFPDHAPVVTTSDISAQRGQVFAPADLFSAVDIDGDSMTKYQLWDSNSNPLSGHFVVNGVAQAAGQVIEITAAQLAQTSFVAGRVSDNLQIRAFDGAIWSAEDNANWSPFSVTVPADQAPIVTTSDLSASSGQSLSLSSLFSVSDADGDSMTKYQLWDSSRDPSSGHFVVNGVAQAAGQIIEIAASQLGQTSFLAGASGDILQIRAFDGIAWSAADNASWSLFHISV